MTANTVKQFQKSVVQPHAKHGYHPNEVHTKLVDMHPPDIGRKKVPNMIIFEL